LRDESIGARVLKIFRGVLKIELKTCWQDVLEFSIHAFHLGACEIPFEDLKIEAPIILAND
jgi:hypothetical protein